jgi:ketosteroid isomerase-like protein
MNTKQVLAGAVATVLSSSMALADADADRRAVAAADTAYQAAVERNDAEAMAAILGEGMVVVLGNGTVHTREDLLNSARQRAIAYERQVEDDGTQFVRLYGRNTAVVTARLWVKGTRKNGTSLEVRLWFSDTYVRTPQGWRYVFGQASLPLPAGE